MKIQYLELKGYKKFKHAHIQHLSWNIFNPIQIILGSNGSGKSSLLRQLLPIVPTKSEFNKNGYRKLVIEHQGSLYELVSDFSRKNKYHSFIKDGEELNVGNGADIQQELIDNHLNIDNLISLIFSINLDWSSITPSIRKKHLYKLNPINMDILVDIHQTIKKNINKTKNNISMLNQRKLQLESKLLSKDEFNILESQYKKYTQLKEHLTMFIVHLQSLQNNIENISLNQTKDLSNTIHHIKELRSLLKYNTYSDKYLDILQFQLKSTNQSIQELEKNIQTLIDEVDKYTTNLKYLTKKDQVEILQNNIIQCKSDIKSLTSEIYQIYSNIDLNDIQRLKNIYSSFQYILQDQESIINQLVNHLNNLDHVISQTSEKYTSSVLLKSISYIDQLTNKLSTINNKIILFQNQISTLELDLKNTDEELSKLKKNKIVIPCLDNSSLTSKCTLYLNYQSNLRSLQNKYNHIHKELHYISNKLNRYQKVQTNLSLFLQSLTKIHTTIESIQNVFKKYPILLQHIKDIYSNINIKEILLTKPLDIIYYIQHVFQYFQCIKRYLHVHENLEKYTLELLNIQQSNQHSKQFIEEIISQKQKTLHKYQSQLSSLYENKKTLESNILKYQRIQYLIDHLKEDYDYINQYIDYLKNIKSKEFYQILIDETNKYSSEISTKLIDITNQLNDQKFLRERLNKEVLSILKDLEYDLKLLENIESIVQNMITNSMKDFLTKWINISNILISKLCTYPMEILIKEPINDSFTFRFPIKISDLHITDISECSSGQKDILKLCMNIGLMIVLDIKDYPLYIDEIDRTFDSTHKTKLLEFLNYLYNNNIISQIFLVNHHAAFYEGFNGNIIVLNDENISCPEKYNQDISIT